MLSCGYCKQTVSAAKRLAVAASRGRSTMSRFAMGTAHNAVALFERVYADVSSVPRPSSGLEMDWIIDPAAMVAGDPGYPQILK
jgi:hypothetical protein